MTLKEKLYNIEKRIKTNLRIEINYSPIIIKDNKYDFVEDFIIKIIGEVGDNDVELAHMMIKIISSPRNKNFSTQDIICNIDGDLYDFYCNTGNCMSSPTAIMEGNNLYRLSENIIFQEYLYYISELWVDKTKRSLGIGAFLVENAKEIIREAINKPVEYIIIKAMPLYYEFEGIKYNEYDKYYKIYQNRLIQFYKNRCNCIEISSNKNRYFFVK